MANGAGRIFNVMKHTSEETNTRPSLVVFLTVKSVNPLILERDDRLEITEEFCVFNKTINLSSIEVGDKLTAFTFNNGQVYFIQQNENKPIDISSSVDDQLSSTSENPVQNKVLTNELDLRYNLSRGQKNITSGTDLNNITTVGTYYSITIEITNSLVNCPVTNAGFKLIVENTTGTNRVVQTIRVNNANTSAIYIRTYTGSWGEWNIVMTGNYSTSERRIGTWIDGKPIYRKIFTSSSFESTYNTGITNISEIVDFRGLVYRKDYPNMIHPIPSRYSKSGYEIDLDSLAKNSGGFTVAITWGSSLNNTKVSKVVFIIEYTKTTD